MNERHELETGRENQQTSARQFGRYNLITRLAKGGMAEIFLASTNGLAGFEKLIVIKRMLPGLATQQAYVEMFLDEARIAAKLNHPNVVQNFDLGIVDEQYFMAMEYLEGQSLFTLIRTCLKNSKKIPLELAVGIVMQAAEGLHYAHTAVDHTGKSLNIVHRDICPQNIFVLYDGNVKVVDFGIAKASLRDTHTRVGTIKGKPAYMSPEQILCKELDGRSDVFSLGIVLWECLVGRRLFRSDNHLQLLRKIVEQDAPSPREFVPTLPVELECIVLRALSRDREQRYQSAQDFRNDLNRFVVNSAKHADSMQIGRLMQSLFAKRMQEMRSRIEKAQDWFQQTEDSKVADISHYMIDTTGSCLSQPVQPVQYSLIRSQSLVTGHGLKVLGIAACIALLLGFVFVSGSMNLDSMIELLDEISNTKVSNRPLLPISMRLNSPVNTSDVGVVKARPETSQPKIDKAALVSMDSKAENVTKSYVDDKTKPGHRLHSSKNKKFEYRLRVIRPKHKPLVLNRVSVGKRKKKNRKRDVQDVRQIVQPIETKGASSKQATGPGGKLRLITFPWTEIYFEGRKIGQTPLIDVELPPGRVDLRAVNKESGIDEHFSITIQSGKCVKKRFNFF